MPSFVLKSDNLGMFKQGLAFSKFDPTFRDAMIAGQTLGINDLWIDCYCIIQGTDETSRDDWNRESVLMHKVYTNALLNIGAAHGKDSQAGCFKVHQRKEDVFGKILWKPSSRSTWSLHRLINSSLRLKERNEMGSEVRSFAILDRGWIVQERMLAQRMLYFGNSGIYWDCASTDIKSEQWPGGRLNGRKELRRGKRYGTWLSAIDWYSRCQLSFPEKDKLVAFEGVGRRVCELTGVEYRDGFPQESLPFSLCWSSTGLDGCRNLSAPSWHWAAARHVQWFDSNLDYEDADSNDNKYRSLVAMLSGPHSFLPEDTRSTQVCIGRPVWMPFVRTIEKSFSALLDDTVYSAEQLVPTRREHNLLIPKKRRHSKVCLIPDDIVEFNDILDHTQIFLLPIWWRCNWNMQLQDPQYYRDTMAFSVTNPAFKKHERRDAVSIESRTLQNFQAMHHGQAERFPHFCGMRYGGIVLKCSGMDVYQRVGMFETNYEEGEGLNSGIRAVYQAMSRSKARLITIV
ncbi:hypothetical protein PRZ48_004028 [Zasmidium cellare]|uniref:Heterokaryon incompatibility domain-containing protein n=1 Tax=Zasmidium cellare TaxID=395010 RepID=A0ABR0EZ15_ZASCE|nr:hypothetical protein PRZ48_004028 [Zasmidium cellare]